MAASVVQIVLAVQVRTTLVAAAAEGARVAATADAGPADGVRRTRAVLAGNVPVLVKPGDMPVPLSAVSG